MSKINKHPVVTSYRSLEDLVELKEWFFDFSPNDKRYRAVQRVKALASRGRIPHALETTALLTSVTLTDRKDDINADSNVLQLSYSMALIRFVNGLLDPYQQSNFAIPLHQLARNLNLPGVFVELRHMGTHEQLPNLDTLRGACTEAMNWLYDHYWLKLGDDSAEEQEDEEEASRDVSVALGDANSDESALSDKQREILDETCARTRTLLDTLSQEMKAYKKIRKMDLDKEYKFGNSTEVGKRYWKCIWAIRELYVANSGPTGDAACILRGLVYRNWLVYNVDKIAEGGQKKRLNPLLIKLYRPLLSELGPLMKRDLLYVILDDLNEHAAPVNTRGNVQALVDTRVGFGVKHESEVVQLLGWVKFLIEDAIVAGDIKSLGGADFASLLVSKVAQVCDSGRLAVLEELQASIKKKNLQYPEVAAVLASRIELLRKEIRAKTIEVPPSLEDLLSGAFEDSRKRHEAPSEVDPEAKRKQRVSVSAAGSVERFFFEPACDWKPTAFGKSV